jgi:nucleotide-binding universal stress UspA family protein
MTQTLRTILVTTDFSDLGNAAVPVAFRLAQAEGAKVVLLHVLEDGTPNPLYAHYKPTASPEERKEVEAEARAGLLALVPKGQASIAHDTRIAHGDPAAEICNAAEELRAGLIVTSSHGRTGLKHALLGSVAEQIVRHAPCSVHVVRK